MSETKVAIQIPVIRILNPFDPREFVHDSLTWSPAKTLDQYLPGPQTEAVVSINGKIVPRERFGRTYLDSTDNLVICPIPTGGGGGDGKNVLAIVAMIAVSVFAPGVGLAIAGSLGGSVAGISLAAGSVGLSVLTAGVVMAGSLLVSALFAPAKPSESAAATEMPSYGIDGAKNTSVEGICVPVGYGKFRQGGNILGLHIDNDRDDNQILYMLISAGEGKVASISDIEINDTPLENFKDVEFQTRLGAANQLPIPWFNDTIVAQNKNQKLTTDWFYSTTTTAVDKLRLDFVAPQGLATIDLKSGAVGSASVDMEIEYRTVGGTWGSLPATSEINSWTDVHGVYAGPVGSQYDPKTGRAWTSTGGVIAYIANPVFNWFNTQAQQITDPVQLEYLANNTPVFTPAKTTILSVDEAITTPSSITSRVPNYVLGIAISAAKRSAVRKSFSTAKLSPLIYEVRVRRTTVQSKLTNVIDAVYLSDINEIVLESLSYPNTALLGLKIRLTDQLSGLPKVTYINGGVEVQTYGSPGIYATADQWYVSASSNPAWVVWDILTNRRYGGAFPTSRLDFIAFRNWAKHCEEQKLTWNGVIDTEMNVWDACQLVLRVGHSQLVNVGTRYTVVTEKKADPVMMFSVANMVQGSYKETWLGTADRANEVDVTFFDKTDSYKQRTIKVYDPSVLTSGAKQRSSAITLYGVVDHETAYKEAQFQLNLNRYILKTVNFSAPMEAVACSVGDLIYVQHDMSEWAFAGRFEGGSTLSEVNLDRTVSMVGGKQYKLLASHDSVQRTSGSVTSVVGNSIFLTGFSGLDSVKRIKIGGIDMRVAGVFNQGAGYGVIVDNSAGIAPGANYTLWDTDVIEEYDVVNVAAPAASISQSVLQLQTPMSFEPQIYSNWMFGESEKVKMPFRVRSVTGSHDYTRDITALQYHEDVYNFSRYGTNGAAVIPPANGIIGPVRSLHAYEESYVSGPNIVSRLVASWQTPQAGLYVGADIYVKKNDEPLEKVSEVKNRTSVVIDAARGDKVTIQVVAFDIFGKRSAIELAPSVSYTVIGEVTGISVGGVTGSGFSWAGKDCKINWRYNATTHAYEFGSESAGGDAGALDPHFKDYEIRVFDKTQKILRRTEYVTANSYTYIYDKNFADGIARNLVFEIRMRDTFNNLGLPATLEAYNPPPTVLSVTNSTTFESATVNYIHSNDPDFAGAQIWLSQISSDLSDLTTASSFLVYQGPDTSVMLPKLIFNTTYYFRIAAYDALGLTELIPSATLQFKTTHLDVAAIADGVLKDSLLIPALQSRINLIDGPANMANSVAARVLAEAVARGAAVTAETTARQTANASMATSIASVTASVGTNASAINTEITARTNADASLASQMNVVAASAAANAASIFSEQQARATADTALASSVSVVQASAAAASAAVTSEQIARANADSVIASYINTLSVTADSHTASIQTQQNVSNGLSAQYTVKIDNNGYVSGFGLASTAVNGVPTSEFVINADKFAVIMPGYANVHPFTIGAVNGTPQVIISSALIGDASINSAKIGTAEIGTLKIAGNAITLPFSVTAGVTPYGSFVSTSLQYLEAGTKIIVIATYSTQHTGFKSANITIGVGRNGFGNTNIANNGFSFENAGNGVISGSYAVPAAGFYFVYATPNGEAGGTCTGLTITALGAQR